jgi:hypothetical protein
MDIKHSLTTEVRKGSPYKGGRTMKMKLVTRVASGVSVAVVIAALGVPATNAVAAPLAPQTVTATSGTGNALEVTGTLQGRTFSGTASNLSAAVVNGKTVLKGTISGSGLNATSFTADVQGVTGAPPDPAAPPAALLGTLLCNLAGGPAPAPVPVAPAPAPEPVAPALAKSSPTSVLGLGSSPSQRAVFPLTLTRTGGIAGFQDMLVVAADGLVSVTHKRQQQWHCQLTPEAVEKLTTAASQVPWPRTTLASAQPAFPDEMVSMVRSPAGSARLEDPELGAARQVFQELLTDLSVGPAAPSLCKAA